MDEKKTARAEIKFARISPRKVQIVCDMIRGQKTDVAMAMMENTPKAGCELMIKLLKSACANAENNFEMDPEKLYICEDLRRRRPHPQAQHAQSSGPYVPHQQTQQPHHHRRG
jgi:hypothetical protein